MKLNKNTNYYLSEQAQLCVVSLFQKALVLMEDVSEDLRQMKFKLDDGDRLVVSNPEVCQISEQDLEKANLSLMDLEEV